jgi:hypothetical protein
MEMKGIRRCSIYWKGSRVETKNANPSFRIIANLVHLSEGEHARRERKRVGFM